MASLLQWESDPLFSAAEVVQDSADRVESVFRLLLHEESLAKGYCPDRRLPHSIEYHRRDLATTLETVKWQLEDFEREVNFLAMADKSQGRQNVIHRHRQFIGAIREQIMNVEKSLENTSVGDSVRITKWVNLNEQDSDGLASFLSGGKPGKYAGSQDSEGDASTSRKFLDPARSSSITEEIAEQKSVHLNMNSIGGLDHNLHLGDNELRKVGSEMDVVAPSIQESASGRCVKESWDLEANEARAKTFSNQNKLRGYYDKSNVFRNLRNFIPIYGSGANRNLTKRWKDGEEQNHSSSGVDVSHAMQSYLARVRLACRCRNFQFSLPELFAGILHFCGWVRAWIENHGIHSSSHSIVLVVALFLALIALGILASNIL